MPSGDPPALRSAQSHERARILVDLAKQIGSSRGDLTSAVHRITEACAQTLEVARCGVWLYDESRRRMSCIDLYDAARDLHSDGVILDAETYPNYFEVLETERAIAAVDARTDPRTREFAASYLVPMGIQSLLDAPIRIRGQMIGVICGEHCGPRRRWSSDEENLAGTFADFVGLAVEAHEHHRQSAKAYRLESQLRQAQKLESMGLLAGGIAHDFNNLLVGILGNAGLALLELDALAPLRPLLEDIRDASTRAAELANEILAYSGRATLVTTAVDLNELIAETVHLLRRTLPSHARLELKPDPEGSTARGDPTALRRVVMNLLTNASQALESRRGTISISTSTVLLPPYDISEHLLGERLGPGEYVRLTVADDGVGMDADTREHLFDPFFTTKDQGRGLGLAVVLGIVSSHGGAILVDSQVGAGTQITILLPASAERPASSKDAGAEALPPARTGTILIADDESIVRAVTRRILVRSGYTVIEAVDGREAIELFHRHRDELVGVVLDLTMPRVSGHEALAQLRLVDRSMPVLLTSGYSHETLPADVASGPRTGFLQKPYTPDKLIIALDQLSGSGSD